MARLKREWRVALVRAYPDLFHPAGDPAAVQAFPDVGDGWRDLLERACARIRAAILADSGTFRATQIKEKYGTLRFYWDSGLSPMAASRAEEAIDLAEARSACTCEVCGEVGQLYGDGWLTTRCMAHAEKRSPVEVRPGFEILIKEWSVRDRRVIRCRRYDREADRFIEVDPTAFANEET
ncbi:hypothetical protein [Bradyrhizobium sp. AS23.2]|uniref:hypothetical protein n=1 Tax=Bradyrhizobium sp. AS23.2 TaxID=1680155 RepID=UPI00093DEAB1|nr:hypothetical protein [Bradyrhizobium sp. AS23.2]